MLFLRFRKRPKNIVIEYIESIGIAILFALVVRALFLQAFRIPTGSMEQTLLIGDFLLVNKFVYGATVPFTDWRLPAISEPESGDIVVFKYPKDQSLDYIKRCVAVGGQTVEIRDKELYVDGELFENPPGSIFMYDLIPKGIPEQGIFPRNQSFNRDNYGPYVVPDGHLFVLGDNRDNSLDSRYWGPLDRDLVVGKALIIYWSWDYREPLYKFFSKVRWSRIGDLIK